MRGARASRGDRGCDAARRRAGSASATVRSSACPPPRGAHVRVERCAKCDALGESLGSNMRECCRGAAGLRRRPAARAPRSAPPRSAASRPPRTPRTAGSGTETEAPAGRASAAAGTAAAGGGGAFARRAAEASAAADFDAATVATVEEVVLLDVRGMHCGGCTANVKRILEMERACVSASVNLANESALVRVAVDVQEHTKYPYAGKGAEAMSGGGGVSESDIARAVRAVGDGLAAVVTEKGFPTTVREACGVAVAGVSASDAAASNARSACGVEESTKRVVVAWALAATCLIATPRTCSTTPCPGLRCCAARPCTPA